MKVKADVIVNMDKREIHSIYYYDKVLNVAIGKLRMNKFYRNRVLKTPIKEFRHYLNIHMPDTNFMVVEMMLDVYPQIYKIKKPVMRKDFPYRCELFPIPALKESVISYEEYSDGMMRVLDKLSCRVSSRWSDKVSSLSGV